MRAFLSGVSLQGILEPFDEDKDEQCLKNRFVLELGLRCQRLRRLENAEKNLRRILEQFGRVKVE
jgi:hypothetical protein